MYLSSSIKYRAYQIRCNKLYNNLYCIKSSFIWVLQSNDIPSERSNQLPRIEIHWFYPTVNMKHLGNVFDGTFSDSFRQNIWPHPHSQDILQSAFCHIWDFLPSCLGLLLTMWLVICVPNDKSGFSKDNCKTSREIKLAQFWIILSPFRDAKYFSSFFQGILIED